jgi:NADPH:quinone reductase-like Zn-dependent oxidoreductase/NAD(P)-dependent dehydrogenase (short-subunit alcohol dehydrogenase family)/acyl carrier protein
VPLPTYPFERKRYWMDLKKGGAIGIPTRATGETSQPRHKPDIADWFYTPSWKRSPLPVMQTDASAAASCTLIFAEESGLGARLANRLAQSGRDVISVHRGSEFAKEDERTYTLNPGRSEDYESLLASLQALGKSPKSIVHLWSVTQSDEAESSELSAEQAQELGFYSLIFLAQALGKQNFTDELLLLVASNDLHEVTGDEEALRPEKATLLGPVKVIPQEYPNITCRSIDVVLQDEEKLAEQLQAELAVKSSDAVVAYRGNHRWMQTYEPFRLDAPAHLSPRLRQAGVYLITGGLGGVGLTLAEYLAKTTQAKLILTGRSSLPPKAEWGDWLDVHGDEDAVSRKIRKVQELESLGAEVLTIAADVADPEQMQEGVKQSLARFGQINGVIHSAGVPAGGVIQLKTPAMAESILSPKLKGTLVLDQIFAGVPLDFFILCSSLTSIVGGFGQVDYCAANAFLDAYANRRNSRQGAFTVSINWDAWRDVGMAAEAAKQRRDGATAVGAAMPQAKDVSHPLFDQCLGGAGDGETYITRFSPIEHWVLSDHKVTGMSTLPGTAYLEMARAAFENHTGSGGTIEMRDVLFLSPLIVAESEEKEVHTVLKKQGDGFEFSILSRLEGVPDGWQEHARGKLALVETARAEERVLIGEIEARCHEQHVNVTEKERTSQQGFMQFGPRWDNLKQIKFGKDQGLALLELPAAFADDVKSYKLHPAMLDSATGFLSIRAQNGSPYLPFGYKSIRVKGSMAGKVYSYARFTEGSQRAGATLKIDISILDEQGRELVEIKEYMLRKVDVEGFGARAEKVSAAEAQNFRLAVLTPGALDSLSYKAATRRKPLAGEVEIEVCATGLNFKEVLIATGLLPLPPGVEVGFGLECAGRITALGSGVEEFKIGDEVLALANPSFSPYVTTPAVWALRKPDHLSFEEAATIPVAFVTAYYALITMGRLKRGERVLIHAAAGGVGLAAVQVAQWVGAQIYATAGNQEKRDFLRSQGIEHVMDSRSLAFADEVMERSEGQGVDVVLNSLGGEFIAKGLSILAPFGRFLEIGKRDIYNNSPLGLRPFDKGLSFFAIDVTPRDTPDLCSTWRQVVEHFSEQTFRPLPRTVFGVNEVAKAFDYMARAAHIGKIVVSLEDHEALRRFAAEGEETGEASAARQWRAASAGLSRVERGAAEKPSAPSKHQVMVQSEEGLLPSEGAHAFSLILSNSQPQILVTARDSLRGGFERPVLFEMPEETSGYQPSHPRPGLSNDYVAPRNETEEAIAEIWQNLLGIERVGIYDNFFELGGDSLLATQVITKMRDALQVDIAVGKMFEDPTVSSLAMLVEPSRWSAQQLQTISSDAESDREEGIL